MGLKLKVLAKWQELHYKVISQ
ncbi:uncharacterized protein G2W53_034733 [Senna tora]|uniref:Uncharacterized protein n=1 Tax=Senna tora TaxID=362788 RepID=A0A834W959_9FABA|nr:uncharacterized protein G2W53_034733 [Senna tora]